MRTSQNKHENPFIENTSDLPQLKAITPKVITFSTTISTIDNPINNDIKPFKPEKVKESRAPVQ